MVELQNHDLRYLLIQADTAEESIYQPAITNILELNKYIQITSKILSESYRKEAIKIRSELTLGSWARWLPDRLENMCVRAADSGESLGAVTHRMDTFMNIYQIGNNGCVGFLPSGDVRTPFDLEHLNSILHLYRTAQDRSNYKCPLCATLPQLRVFDAFLEGFLLSPLESIGSGTID